MITVTIDGATLSIDHDGSELDTSFGAMRQRYAYVITTPEWQYVGNDIRSGCNAAPDEQEALRTLCSFLYACSESYRHWMATGTESDNYGLFPPHVAEWSYMVDDELSMLAIDPADLS